MKAVSQASEFGGLETTVVDRRKNQNVTVVVLLHGYNMSPADLSPFGSSLNVPAVFLFPRGPLALKQSTRPEGGFAWWSIDEERRHQTLQNGPRELANEMPPGLPVARERLGRFLKNVMQQYQPRQMILGGFSQGGMLACDWALHGDIAIQSLILMSTSRITFANWLPQQWRLQDLPVFISHGTQDDDLSFAAGERLRDFLANAGSKVTWLPFEGGHEIPLVVWRAMRTFLGTLPNTPAGREDVTF